MEAQESNNILHIDIDLKIYCDQKIGRGAFGVVFRGIYKEAICAVKVLHDVATTMTSNLPIKSAGNEEPVTKAFNQECTFLKSFKHPNIVKHLSTTHHPTSNNLILVTEVLDCSLRAYFSLEGYGTKSLTISCETSLSKDVAAGLAYIHGKRIIHRDLCGDNILLRLGKQNELPMAKISDFGMSRILDPSRLSSTLTAMGHRMGYLPPEAPRIDNEEYDHSLDVFSLGAVMVQIVCKLETVKSPATRSYYVAQIPDTHLLKPLIVECLQKEKDKRPLAETLSKSIMPKCIHMLSVYIYGSISRSYNNLHMCRIIHSIAACIQLPSTENSDSACLGPIISFTPYGHGGLVYTLWAGASVHPMGPIPSLHPNEVCCLHPRVVCLHLIFLSVHALAGTTVP